MFKNRISIALLSIFVFSAFPGVAANAGSGAGEPQQAKSGDGPTLGKWEFTGKDNKGLAWTGTLTIEKPDPQNFDVDRFHSMCSLEVESKDPNQGGRSVSAPCTYDKAIRAVAFSTGVSNLSAYTAILSADSKSLTQGKWTESEKSRQSGTKVLRTGDWSARFKQ